MPTISPRRSRLILISQDQMISLAKRRRSRIAGLRVGTQAQDLDNKRKPKFGAPVTTEYRGSVMTLHSPGFGELVHHRRERFPCNTLQDVFYAVDDPQETSAKLTVFLDFPPLDLDSERFARTLVSRLNAQMYIHRDCRGFFAVCWTHKGRPAFAKWFDCGSSIWVEVGILSERLKPLFDRDFRLQGQ